MRIVLACLMLSGCGLTPQLWAIAEEKCKANGGIKVVFPHLDIKVICTNGAVFEGERK